MTAPIPPIESPALLTLLVQVAALLLLALLLGRLAVRLRLPPIVGELLAGVILGPSLLGNLAPVVHGWLFPADARQMNMLDAVAHLGVLLLVGIAGMSLNSAVLRRRAPTAVRISFFGLLVPISLGLLIGYLAPAAMIPETAERPVFALFLAVAMCVTAIPVIAKTLSDMKLIHRDVGQTILTAGMIDDTVGWLLLSVVAAMATVGLHAHQIGRSVLYLLLFVLFAMLLGRRLVRGALRAANRSQEPGPIIAAAVVIILMGASLTQFLHLEAVFGAFVAGILIGELPRELRQRLAPLRVVVMSVLAPIFLATAGLRVDLSVLLDPMVLLAALVVLSASIVGKFLGAYLGARVGRLSHWEGLAVGAGMNARGVVEIVVAMVGLRLGVLNITAFTIIALVAIVTSLMAPPLLRLAMARVAANADEMLRKADLEEEWSTVRPLPPSGR